MQSGGGENGITAEEVIARLKDEGDFDKLRLKIIQKLKENEELRNKIISTVKQSATLHREGTENLKPRQISDAIHEEIGTKVMAQVSDALWGVIRSSDSMKSEISETVECVYNRLVNPKVQESSPSNKDSTPGDQEPANNISLANTASEREDKPLLSEPNEAPATTAYNIQQPNDTDEGRKEEAQPVGPDNSMQVDVVADHHSQRVLSLIDEDPSVPPGFATSVPSEPQHNGPDEDPDVPPGFG